MKDYAHRTPGFNKRRLPVLFSVLFSLVVCGRAFSEEVKTTYVYNLSDFTGTVPSSAAALSLDPKANEIYVTDPSQSSVRIFNENGMEVYSFGEDLSFGNIYGAAATENGEVLLLTYSGPDYRVLLCNYRGEPISKIEPRDVPADFSSGFRPILIEVEGGYIYLVDRSSMKIIKLDRYGEFVRGYDVFAIMGLKENERNNVEISGFQVDASGDMLFTVPVLFKAFILSPEGSLASFGQRGSSPGKFNLVSGIVSDGKGLYFVADLLKCVVMVFDSDFRFLNQFGYRGPGPGNLILPGDLVFNGGKLYVSQGAQKGISVFTINRL